MEIDKVIHEPARLRIMMILSGVDQADFNFLVSTLEMTRGNLSSHTDRLEQAGYPARPDWRDALGRYIRLLESGQAAHP